MNKSSISISIIVPIYNTEKYLKKCIDSLINQTYKDIEIILVNDGSKDNSEQIINKYDDKRIKYFKKKNEGIGKTRNYGIDKATGDYLMFIDSDDYIANDCCQEFVNEISNTKADIVVSDFYKDRNGTYEYIKIDDFGISNLKKDSNLLIRINPGPCNKVYKRDLVIKNHIRFNEQYKYEDSPFVIECLIKANKIAKINKALSYYCIHSNSETTVRDDRVFDIIKIIDIIRDKAKDYNYLKNDMNKFTVDLITNYTIQQRYQKNRKIRNSFINESFKYMKSNVKDYRNKKYYPNKSFFRRQIESHKLLTKLYCNIFAIKYR